ncbi:MAG: HAMP domain-containing histidine kinase [Oscillospiraceae bacterium]|nr:HAMP domain-containing histidine kinase [Oscillospiraceae bacterium]
MLKKELVHISAIGRIRHSVQLKYALSYIVIILAVLGFLNVFPVVRIRDMLFDAKYTSLQNHVSVVASSLSPLGFLSPEEVSRIMELLGDAQSTGTRVIITDNDNHTVYDNLPGDESLLTAAVPPELTRAIAGNSVFRAVYAEGQLTCAAAQPVVYRNGIIGAVYLLQRETEQAGMLLELQSDLMRLTAAIIAAAVIAAFLMSRILTRRVLNLLRAIKAVRAGQFGYRLTVRGKDEISELGLEFNQLAERLEATEEMRVRFVSDASHELKTPLAGIRLLTDSIVTTPGISQEIVLEFVEDIGGEAERLTRLTEKLLTLTRLDGKVTAEATTVVHVDVLASDAIRLLSPLAAQRGIEITAHMDRGCDITGEPDDIFRAVFNLIENAVKYNTQGGSVHVYVYNKAGEVRLIVDDTGVGVPKGEEEHIFERFYRVDKARNGKISGSGLGLSIVKETALKYGGTVKVSGREPCGSRFELCLPIVTDSG